MGPDVEVAADRRLLDRASTVELLADSLRERIIEGVYRPGDRLAEESIVKSLKVSRNTLREAFRLLTHSRLLVHELNRGVFVSKPSVEDVIDVYRVRRLVECAAVRSLDGPPDVTRLRAAVAAGEAATRGADWRGLGTANMKFHQAVGALLDSSRIDEQMRDILAELRLVFLQMDDPKRFHEPYLERNHEMLVAIEAGDGAGAERLLLKYLDDSQHQIVEAYRNA